MDLTHGQDVVACPGKVPDSVELGEDRCEDPLSPSGDKRVLGMEVHLIYAWDMVRVGRWVKLHLDVDSHPEIESISDLTSHLDFS